MFKLFVKLAKAEEIRVGFQYCESRSYQWKTGTELNRKRLQALSFQALCERIQHHHQQRTR